jgi:hypothetical protein
MINTHTDRIAQASRLFLTLVRRGVRLSGRMQSLCKVSGNLLTSQFKKTSA